MRRLTTASITPHTAPHTTTHKGDRIFKAFLAGMAGSVIVLLGLLTLFIIHMAWPALMKFGLPFFVTSNWDPVQEIYGALPVIYGTLISSLIALLLSVPISVAVALFLEELAPRRLGVVIGFLVEMLAAIPSVVYGLWGIFVLAPWLRSTVQPLLGQTLGFLPLFQGPPYGVGMMSAGIILAIMITPTIAAICKEVFRNIPRVQKEAALGLGATRWETLRLSVLSSSKMGILGASILGLGRAIGETMAVTMVIGNRAEISASLFAPAQTMASVLANEYAEATTDLHISALAAVGFALFLVSFCVNVTARLMVQKSTRKKRRVAL